MKWEDGLVCSRGLSVSRVQLARVLRCDEEDIPHLTTERQRVTARVLTDTHSGNDISTRLHNAEHWVQQVHDAAFAAGVKAGRELAQADIRERLGL